MQLNKSYKIIDSLLLKIWGFHMVIFYPICSFLEDNLEVKRLSFKEDIDPEFWKTALLSPLSALLGLWEKFPFFIFMAFVISIILGFLMKKNAFLNYFTALLVSYLIVYFIHLYNRDIFYYIIPSLIITLIVQVLIFRNEIFKLEKH